MDHDACSSGSVLHSAQRHLDGAIVLSVQGEVDLANASSLRAQLTTAIETGTRLIIVDLGDLRYIDCSGIDALLDAHRTVIHDGQSIVVAVVPPMVQRVFEIIRLEEIISVFSTVEAAVESLRRGESAAGC